MSQSIISPKLFRFLRELKENNDRNWFAENKSRYEDEVREPAIELVRQLEKPLSRAAPMLCVVPKGHGGSVMRIYRDTRFGKDKTPYKTNVGISVRHQAEKDIHAPGIYIHLDPCECFIGAGCWRPQRETLAAIRSAIDRDPKGWLKARNNKAMKSVYKLSGESLKTSPRDYSRDHAMIEDLKRIDFIAVSPLKPSEFTSGDTVKILIERIKKAKPLMEFICDAIKIPY